MSVSFTRDFNLQQYQGKENTLLPVARSINIYFYYIFQLLMCFSTYAFKSILSYSFDNIVISKVQMY